MCANRFKSDNALTNLFYESSSPHAAISFCSASPRNVMASSIDCNGQVPLKQKAQSLPRRTGRVRMPKSAKLSIASCTLVAFIDGNRRYPINDVYSWCTCRVVRLTDS